jgi:hypothetical protein
MSGSTGGAPTPMSSIPRTSRAAPRRPLSSHSAQGPGSAPRWGRVLLSRPVLVVGQGMARRVVMAAVGRRRCWLSTHAIAPRGRAWTTAIAYESGREPTGGWDCSCSSGASVERLNSATLARVHESRSAARVREMTAGAAQLHGKQNSPRGPFRLLVESGCRGCTRRAMSSRVARTFSVGRPSRWSRTGRAGSGQGSRSPSRPAPESA